MHEAQVHRQTGGVNRLCRNIGHAEAAQQAPLLHLPLFYGMPALTIRYPYTGQNLPGAGGAAHVTRGACAAARLSKTKRHMASNVGSRAFQNARLQKKLKKQAETLLPAALSAYREGRQTDAQVLCRQLLADLPDFFDVLQLLGVSLVECSRFAEGVPYLERAVALDPRSADAHCNLGFTLFNLERYAEARVLLEKAVMLRPNFPTAQRNLANTLLRLELAEPAIAAFTRIIELNPGDSDAWCNRGVAELMLKRWDAAALSSERALALQPGHFEAIVNKGLAHLELRHY